jgi:molybdopterin synthase sulfur carrier subunit
MKVKFHATLRQITGAKVVDFNLPDGGALTAQVLLDAVLARFPALRKELLDPEGRLFGHVHFFINGRDVQFHEKALQTPLLPSDEIDIFPAVGGG